MDRKANVNRNGVGIALFGPFGISVEYALIFDFLATNNVEEYEVYEALVLGLQLVLKVRALSLLVYHNSQLIVNQFNEKYKVKDVIMSQ